MKINYVFPKRNFTLRVYFDDGDIRQYDARLLFEDKRYESLTDIDAFMRAEVCDAGISWGDLQLEHEAAYRGSVPIERIEVTINGDPEAIPINTNIQELILSRGMPTGSVVAEVNEQVIQNEQHAKTYITAGAVIELLRFVGGG